MLNHTHLNANNLAPGEILDEISRMQKKKVKKVGDFEIGVQLGKAVTKS